MFDRKYAVYRDGDCDDTFFAFLKDEEESGRSVSFDSPEEMMEVAYALMTLAAGQGPAVVKITNGKRDNSNR